MAGRRVPVWGGKTKLLNNKQEPPGRAGRLLCGLLKKRRASVVLELLGGVPRLDHLHLQGHICIRLLRRYRVMRYTPPVYSANAETGHRLSTMLAARTPLSSLNFIKIPSLRLPAPAGRPCKNTFEMYII